MKQINPQTAGSCYPTIDICLSQNNLPIIGYAGIIETGDINAYFCDSIDGYNGNWNMFNSTSGLGGGSTVALIPTGNTTVLLIAIETDADGVLRVLEVESGITANSTAFINFSDSVLEQHNYYIGLDDNMGVGFSWNTTHGFISYCEGTQGDAMTFSFDFETLTRSDEIKYYDNGGSGFLGAYGGVTVHNNEPFVTCQKTAYVVSYPQSVIGNEYHDSLYDGYHNISASDFILESYALDWLDYSPHGINTAKTTDSDGNCVIMIAYSAYVCVTYFNVNGEYEYSEPEPEPEPEVFEPYYVDSNGFFIVGFIICSIFIFVFAVKIKYGSRR